MSKIGKYPDPFMGSHSAQVHDALGGLGVESVAARADACYYSSFTCAYFRLPGIDPEWHNGELYDSVAGGHHGPTAAYAAAAFRLTHRAWRPRWRPSWGS